MRARADTINEQNIDALMVELSGLLTVRTRRIRCPRSTHPAASDPSWLRDERSAFGGANSVISGSSAHNLTNYFKRMGVLRTRATYCLGDYITGLGVAKSVSHTDLRHSPTTTKSIFDKMDELPQVTPEDMDGPPLLSRYEIRKMKQNEEAERINNDDSLDEPAKVDALSKVRGWFVSDTTIVDAYMADELTAAQAAAKMADPIDESYSTANHGKALWDAEQVARNQRQYHTPEKAVEIWGVEEDFPEPDETTRSLPSTEGQLWELWYSVLHAAKRIPWDDNDRQEKLLELVETLKARPDPPPPERMTVALKGDWIWESSDLWSTLGMLGPSARESWNDGCGFGAGWTPAEQRAWINVNAFVARITCNGLLDFSSYALWALGDALEDQLEGNNLHHVVPVPQRLSLYVKVAAVWVFIAGEYIYESALTGDEAIDVNSLELEPRWKIKFPKSWKRSDTITDARWAYWRRMFKHLSEKDELEQDSRDMAAGAASAMASIQEAYES